MSTGDLAGPLRHFLAQLALGIAVLGSIVTAVYRAHLHLAGIPAALAATDHRPGRRLTIRSADVTLAGGRAMIARQRRCAG